MKIMQIGAGRWGSNHLRVLSHLPVELYVAEISEAARQRCIEQGIPRDHISDSYRDFLEVVSAVDVVTPASSHFTLGKELLETGKSVFIEKPIAETAAQAIQLAALAAERQLVLQVGHIFRYDPAADFIKAYLHSGEMGAVQSMNGMFSGFKRPRADGGVVISDAIHFIDFFNYLLDALPNKVIARCEDLLGRGMDDMSWVWMSYDGIPALVEANYFSPEKKRMITITGDQATLVCDFTSSQDKVKIYRNRHILDHDTWKSAGGEIISKEISPAEPLFLELKEFIDCVRNRSQPRADARAGADAMKVVEAAMQSHAAERAIEI
jgi:UDP-N-acetylglucosamine 3-dehydrogenase